MPEVSFYNWLLLTAWVTVALWLAGAYTTVRGIMRQKGLAPLGSSDERLKNADAPLVSILVPARNEAGRVLASSIHSMLKQDYGRFEVVAVDDRSTDATGAILHSIATADRKLRVVDGAEPPAGWLGKPHAMQQAFATAQGEWILATDADMIFDSRVVRTSVAYAAANNYDALTLIPFVECLTFWERVFMPTFGWFMLIARPVERVNDERRNVAVGIGGFFLFRRAWLERIGGWSHVRAEVAEDLRMAETLKSLGARLRLEYAPDMLRTRMQTNLREIWEGFTKNLFAGARFNLLQAAMGGIAVLMFSVAPVIVAAVILLLAAAGAGDTPDRMLRLFLPLLSIYIVQVVTFAVINRNLKLPLWYAALAPLGHLLFVSILFNSAVKIWTRSGVSWKGRVLYNRDGVRPPRSADTRFPIPTPPVTNHED